MLLELDREKPSARVLWKVGGTGERPHQTKGLHAVITTPIVEGDYFYGTCSYGELRGLRLEDSKRLWNDDTLTRQGRRAVRERTRRRVAPRRLSSLAVSP